MSEELKETKVEMVEMEMDLSEDTVTGLLEYAKVNILKDKDALINWAVNDILEEVVKTDGKILGDTDKLLMNKSYGSFAKDIEEGNVSKGGVNKAPTTPRPPAPVGQGGSGDVQ
tara:strand:- start:2009 stop:2350 length:342 start_codon:yes stop_codon:yes gene_type:complete